MPSTDLSQVAPGVHRYADGLVNWYLIEEDSELALVDAGWPRSWSRVEGAVASLGRSTSSITHVVLTHGHPDHLGAAEKIRTQAGAEVHAHRTEVSRTKGEAKGSSPFALVPSLVPTLYRPSAVGFVLHATVRGFMTPTWVKAVTPFDSGQQLDVPGHPVAVPTPGHTAGHVALHLPDAGVVFTGDELCSYDPFSGQRGPRFLSDAVNADPAGVRRSADAIGALDAGTVLFGHGEPFAGTPAEAVARARAADEGS